MIGEVHLRTKSICIPQASVFINHLSKGKFRLLNRKIFQTQVISHIFSQNLEGHDWLIDLFYVSNRLFRKIITVITITFFYQKQYMQKMPYLKEMQQLVTILTYKIKHLIDKLKKIILLYLLYMFHLKCGSALKIALFL